MIDSPDPAPSEMARVANTSRPPAVSVTVTVAVLLQCQQHWRTAQHSCNNAPNNAPLKFSAIHVTTRLRQRIITLIDTLIDSDKHQ